ncbi:MAG: hypothetical protein JNK41_06785 [Saprospiraceae bacterium]|nr:hypothetical protein [Saprospiraceae bacterium]
MRDIINSNSSIVTLPEAPGQYTISNMRECDVECLSDNNREITSTAKLPNAC